MAKSLNIACHRLQRTEFALSSYTEFVPAGVTLEDAMSFPYWAHVNNAFRLNDIVSLVAQDGAFDVTCRIIRLGPGFIDFRVVNEWRPPVDDTGDDRLEIGWGGPRIKWFVRETATGKRLADGLDKPAAQAEILRLSKTKEAA